MIDGRLAGGQFGTAPQAGTIPGVFSFLCAIVKTAIGFFGRLHRANRAAVNAGRSDTYEKYAVKTRVAGKECFVTRARIFRHTSFISP